MSLLRRIGLFLGVLYEPTTKNQTELKITSNLAEPSQLTPTRLQPVVGAPTRLQPVVGAPSILIPTVVVPEPPKPFNKSLNSDLGGDTKLTLQDTGLEKFTGGYDKDTHAHANQRKKAAESNRRFGTPSSTTTVPDNTLTNVTLAAILLNGASNDGPSTSSSDKEHDHSDHGASHDSGSSYGGSDYGGSSYGGSSYGGSDYGGSSYGGSDGGGGFISDDPRLDAPRHRAFTL